MKYYVFLCDEASALNEIQNTIQYREEEVRTHKKKLIFRDPKQRNNKVVRLVGKKLFALAAEKRAVRDAAKVAAQQIKDEKEKQASATKPNASTTSGSTNKVKVETSSSQKDEAIGKPSENPTTEANGLSNKEENKKSTEDGEAPKKKQKKKSYSPFQVVYDEPTKKWIGSLRWSRSRFCVGAFETKEEAEAECKRVLAIDVDKALHDAAVEEAQQGGPKNKKILSSTVLDELISAANNDDEEKLKKNITISDKNIGAGKASSSGVRNTNQSAKNKYPKSTMRAMTSPLTSLVIEYMENERAKLKEATPEKELEFQVNDWGTNGVVEHFYKVLGSFSLRKAYDVIYALIGLNIVSRVVDPSRQKRHIPLFRWNGLNAVEENIKSVREQLRAGTTASERNDMNLEDIAIQLLEHLILVADKHSKEGDDPILKWADCLASIKGSSMVQDNAKRRMNDILSAWKAVGVVKFIRGKHRWSDGVVLVKDFILSGESVDAAKRVTKKLAEKTRKESRVVPFSEMDIGSKHLLASPSFGVMTQRAEVSINNSPDAGNVATSGKTASKNAIANLNPVGVNVNSVTGTPITQKVEGNTNIVATKGENVNTGTVPPITSNKDTTGNSLPKTLATISFEIYTNGTPELTEQGPSRIPDSSDKWPKNHSH